MRAVYVDERQADWLAQSSSALERLHLGIQPGHSVGLVQGTRVRILAEDFGAELDLLADVEWPDLRPPQRIVSAERRVSAVRQMQRARRLLEGWGRVGGTHLDERHARHRVWGAVQGAAALAAEVALHRLAAPARVDVRAERALAFRDADLVRLALCVRAGGKRQRQRQEQKQGPDGGCDAGKGGPGQGRAGRISLIRGRLEQA